MKRLHALPSFFLFLGVSLLGMDEARACFAIKGTAKSWVRDAEVIVRARAVEQIDVPSVFAAGRPTTEIRFEILEQLKGEPLYALRVPGKGTSRPDFNDDEVPYKRVRPAGRSGSCYAREYQIDGEFLLLLKNVNGRLTPYWAAMGATNEQIRGADDPWLAWVRAAITSAAKPSIAAVRDEARARANEATYIADLIASPSRYHVETSQET